MPLPSVAYSEWPWPECICFNLQQLLGAFRTVGSTHGLVWTRAQWPLQGQEVAKGRAEELGISFRANIYKLPLLKTALLQKSPALL